MFDKLPAEGTLEILSYLPCVSLCAMEGVSRDWKAFMDTNGEYIYRNAARLHRFVSSGTTLLSDLRSRYSERSLDSIDEWKSFCRRRSQIEKAWLGLGPSTLKKYDATGTSVHRIKVDEQAGYIITTLQRGGLLVTDLAQNEVLWSLSEQYVRQYAHCEYDQGFLIFDRRDGSKEVWRRACDYDPHNLPEASHPDDLQHLASSQAANKHLSATGRGHFKPWALLQVPDTLAYRFVFPTLLVAGENQAYLWDIPTAQLIQTLQGTQNFAGELLGQITYVELSKRYVFICGINTLRIFSCIDGRAVYDIPSRYRWYGNWRYHLTATDWSRVSDSSVVMALHNCNGWYNEDNSNIHLYDYFIAVHVSPCGSHLVALLHSSRLVVIYGFERLLRGEIALHDAAVDIQLGSTLSSSEYLAFENRRIAVATSSGVFVLFPRHIDDDIDEPQNPLPSSGTLISNIRICRAMSLNNSMCLEKISCLQMTDTGLFLNWDPNFNFLPDLDMWNFAEPYNSSLGIREYQAVDGGDLFAITHQLRKPFQTKYWPARLLSSRRLATPAVYRSTVLGVNFVTS